MGLGQIDVLESLVDGAYAAALDDTLWVEWADRLLGELGGRMGSFVVLDAATGVVEQLIHLRAPLQLAEQYSAYHMGALDPQMPYAASLSGSGFYLDTDHIDPCNPKTLEFMSWLTNNFGVRHYMTTVARLDGGRVRAGVSIHRAVADGPTPLEEQRKLAAILPEITRAMDLGFVHSNKLKDAYWSGLAGNLTKPAILLDERGRTLRLTSELSDLLASNDGLDMRGGHLFACNGADDERLQAIVARATTQAGPRSGGMRVRRPSGRAAFVLTAYPLPRAARVLAPAEAAALVTVVDPTAVQGAPNALWREIFKFTPREAELAMCLMAGHSLESAAVALKTSLHTVRVHLRRVFAKTGVARQAELIRLLGRIG